MQVLISPTLSFMTDFVLAGNVKYNSNFRKAYKRLQQHVDESKFCAGGVGGDGVCYGDSGGKYYHIKWIFNIELE